MYFPSRDSSSGDERGTSGDDVIRRADSECLGRGGEQETVGDCDNVLFPGHYVNVVLRVVDIMSWEQEFLQLAKQHGFRECRDAAVDALDRRLDAADVAANVAPPAFGRIGGRWHRRHVGRGTTTASEEKRLFPGQPPPAEPRVGAPSPVHSTRSDAAGRRLQQSALSARAGSSPQILRHGLWTPLFKTRHVLLQTGFPLLPSPPKA